jgi:hypothetical protein
MMPSNDAFIIFLHIQKTGGITLQRILRKKFGPSIYQRVFRVMTGRGKPLPLEASLKAKKMRDRYFAGHVGFGVHRLLPQPFHYVTLLREPVSRIVSLYYFARSNPTAFYHRVAKDVTLEEFSSRIQMPELDNGQTRFIAGDPTDLFINRTPFGQCDQALLEKAKYNIEHHFSVVGLTEQFDHSMILLSEVMNWKDCHYLRLNSAPKKPPIPESLVDKIAAQNWLDVELYQFAQQHFESQLMKYNITAERVQSYRQKNARLNAYLGQPYKYYKQAKSLVRGQSNRP